MTVFHKPLWDKFNDRQREAIRAVKGQYQICAVAGSGKTTVTVHRTEHMINDLKIDASSIALMTFTAKAAEEMGDRLKKLINKKDYESMFCGTSHSFGYRILAKEYKEMNHPLKDFTRRDFKDPGLLTGNSLKFFSESVKDSLLKLPLETAIIREIEGIGINQFLKVVSLCKNNDLDQFQYEDVCILNDPTPNGWAYIHFYKMYEKMKLARKAIDFDDMLFLAVRLFRANPSILKKYQKKIKYVMIDETQDNNKVQYALAEMIALPESNLFVVGDDDQSVYAFRGAEPNLFITFCERFPKAVMIPLEYNYRSRTEILNAANKLIRNNTNRIEKQLVAGTDNQEKSVFYSHFGDEIEEAEYVAKEIDNLCNDPSRDFTDSIDFKRVFIIYRTNAQNKEMEDALITKGIPYVIHGGMSFYERKEVKDILAYLRLVEDEDDDEAFKRVYNTPSRYLGKAFFDKISHGKSSLWSACDTATLKPSERNGVEAFKTLVNNMKELYEDEKKKTTLSDLIDYLMENGYADHLKKDNKEEPDDEDNEIVDKMKFFVKRFDSVKNLIGYVEMMSGKRKENVNGVQLMTVHRSKGLEALAVFGIGMNENLLPHARSIEAFITGENLYAIEEERRLAYVLVTRAEQLAYLSSTSTFNGKEAGASRFIGEMELVSESDQKSIKEKVAKKEEVVKVEKPITPKPVEKVGVGMLSEIVDIADYVEKVVEKVVEIEESEDEEDDAPPDGYEYVDDPYFGRTLKPLKKGKVSSKYF